MTKMPLEGIRVIDCPQMVAGPLPSMLLAQAGTQVAKLELCSREAGGVLLQGARVLPPTCPLSRTRSSRSRPMVVTEHSAKPS